MEWLIVGIQFCFPKAAQCRQIGPHGTRMKGTAKKSKKKKKKGIHWLKASSYLQFCLLDNPSRTWCQQAPLRPGTLVPAVRQCQTRPLPAPQLAPRCCPARGAGRRKAEERGRNAANRMGKTNNRKAVRREIQTHILHNFQPFAQAWNVGRLPRPLPPTQPLRVAPGTRRETWNDSLWWQSVPPCPLVLPVPVAQNGLKKGQGEEEPVSSCCFLCLTPITSPFLNSFPVLVALVHQMPLSAGIFCFLD